MENDIRLIKENKFMIYTDFIRKATHFSVNRYGRIENIGQNSHFQMFYLKCVITERHIFLLIVHLNLGKVLLCIEISFHS